MKSFLLALAILLTIPVFAQINNVTLQASGLTCSMCSNSINKSLKAIPYVNEVKANIKTSTFLITFKPDAVISFDQLKKKVEDAGFHVAKLTANIKFDNLQVRKDKHSPVAGTNFHFVNVDNQVLQGDKDVQILDKGFVTTKEFKKGGTLTKLECYKTGVTASCCTKDGIGQGSRVYHVTL